MNKFYRLFTITWATKWDKESQEITILGESEIDVISKFRSLAGQLNIENVKLAEGKRGFGLIFNVDTSPLLQKGNDCTWEKRQCL